MGTPTLVKLSAEHVKVRPGANAGTLFSQIANRNPKSAHKPEAETRLIYTKTQCFGEEVRVLGIPEYVWLPVPGGEKQKTFSHVTSRKASSCS